MKIWLLLPLLTVMSAGCANTKQAVAYKPTPTCAKVVNLSFGGAFCPQTRYVVDGVRACREICKPRLYSGGCDYPISSQVEVFPPAERWRSFWQTVDRLGLEDWKHEYSPHDVGETIYDGMQWWLTVSTLNGVSESQGSNAYPTLGHPKRTTTNDAAFVELEKAFKELLNEPAHKN